MISFLAPFALVGLAALAVPVVVHIFKPRRVHVVPFTSLRWLRASQHRLSRRIQWHQLLLFLLRASILIMLVLAAARPIWMRRGAGTTQRFVILDAGRGMSYNLPDGPEPMKTARALAENLVAETGPERVSTVLVVGRSTRAMGPLSSDTGRYIERIRELSVEGAENPVTSALMLIPPLRRNAGQADVIELFFITSNLSPTWNQADISEFMRSVDAPVRVHVMEVAPPDPQNAWIAAAEIREADDRSASRIRVQVGAAGGRDQERVLRLSGIEGMPDMQRDVRLTPGRAVWSEFELPPTLDLENKTALLTLEPPDGMPDDDRFWLRLRPRGRQTILVLEPESTRVRELRPAFYLRTALETLYETMPGRFAMLSRTPQTLRETDISLSDLIFMVEPRQISDSLMDALKERVAGGAGLVVFLGPLTEVDFYNQNMFDPLLPAEGMMTREIGGLVNHRDAGRMVNLSALRWEHPVLNPFMDPSYGDLAIAGFGEYLRLPKTPELEGERVLARFPDGTPAMIESDFGVGRIFLMNMTANDVWGDLPRRRGFVPMIDGLISYLGGSAVGGSFYIGEQIRLALPSGVKEGSVRFFDLQENELRLDIQRQAGRIAARIRDVMKPGVYKLAYETEQGDSIREPVVVQSGRAYSAMPPMDNDVLKSWWEPAAFSVAVPDADIKTRSAIARGRIESWLLILAILALIVETVACSRLCPRAKPVIVSDSLVARRGFFKERDAAAQEEPPGEGALS